MVPRAAAFSELSGQPKACRPGGRREMAASPLLAEARKRPAEEQQASPHARGMPRRCACWGRSQSDHSGQGPPVCNLFVPSPTAQQHPPGAPAARTRYRPSATPMLLSRPPTAPSTVFLGLTCVSCTGGRGGGQQRYAQGAWHRHAQPSHASVPCTSPPTLSTSTPATACSPTGGEKARPPAQPPPGPAPHLRAAKRLAREVRPGVGGNDAGHRHKGGQQAHGQVGGAAQHGGDGGSNGAAVGGGGRHQAQFDPKGGQIACRRRERGGNRMIGGQAGRARWQGKPRSRCSGSDAKRMPRHAWPVERAAAPHQLPPLPDPTHHSRRGQTARR